MPLCHPFVLRITAPFKGNARQSEAGSTQDMTASQKPTHGGASSGRRDLAFISNAGFPPFLPKWFFRPPTCARSQGWDRLESEA